MTLRPSLVLLLGLALHPGHLLAQTRFLSPQWSPDGRRLMFAANLDNARRFDLFAVNADGAGLVRVREDARDGSWSPDQKTVAFAAMNGGSLDIYTVRADGSNLRQLTRTPEMEYQPLWSPDGRRIVFISIPTGAGQRHDIHVMNADGTGRVPLTHTPAAEEQGVSWSPDGTRLAFASNRDGNWEIYSMTATGTDVRRLTNDAAADNAPSYAPDGRSIAFTSDRGGARRTWKANPDGSVPTLMAEKIGSAIAWSADGRWLAYVGQADGSSGVFVAPVSNPANPRRVTPAPPTRLAALRWMAGCWERRTAQQVTVEMWMQPAGELMLGASRTVAGGVTSEFEQLRLDARGDTLVYTALPSRQKETAFRSTQYSDSAFVVENLAHDFPQRISYRRRGADSLIARIEGPGPNGTRGIDFPMRRISCVP